MKIFNKMIKLMKNVFFKPYLFKLYMCFTRFDSPKMNAKNLQ